MKLPSLLSLALILLAACTPAAPPFPPTAAPATATHSAPTDQAAAPATSTDAPARATPTPTALPQALTPNAAVPDVLERSDLAVISPANLDRLELLVAFHPGPPAPVGPLLFSPDHTWLIFGLGAQPAERSLPVYVWDLGLARPQQILDSASTSLSGVALSPDASLLAVTGSGPMRLWNTTAWQPVAPPAEGTALPAALAFAPEGWLAFGFRGDGRLAAWQPGEEAERWIVQAHDLDVTALAVSTRAATIATAGLDGRLRLWDASSGEDEHTLSAEAGAMTRLQFTPDDQLLFSYEKSGTVRVWRLSDFKQALDFKVCSSGLPGCTALDFSPDRRLLAVNDPARPENPGVDFYDPVSGASQGRLASPAVMDPDQIASLAFSPDGRLLALGSLDGYIQLWGVTGGLFAHAASLQVAEPGDGLNLRDRPALGGSIRSQLRQGETLQLVEGPLLAEGYNWWRIHTGEGREGWIVEVPEWFEKGE